MELTCPHCDARYRVSPDSVPPEGRSIVCAKCGESWFQPGTHAEERAIASASAADMLLHAGPLGEGLPDVGGPMPVLIGPAAGRAPSWVEPEPRRGGLGTVGWVLLLLVIALLAAGGYAWRAGLLNLPPA